MLAKGFYVVGIEFHSILGRGRNRVFESLGSRVMQRRYLIELANRLQKGDHTGLSVSGAAL